jgi:RimJ/RimL family protein N-acetyltransferase
MQTPEVRASLHLPDDVGREQAWLAMAGFLGQWELRGTGQWAAVEKASGELVGRVGSHWPERADWPGIEIGWSLHPDHWGKGYATEGGRATIDYVFAHHDVNEVFSLILEDNARSQAVARRLGFELFDTRFTLHFPSAPHGIWRLER